MSVFLINLVNDVLVLLTLAFFVRAVLTWIPTVDHEHPLVQMITRVTDPILKPIRRLLPLFDGLDLSPLVAVVLLWLIGYIVIQVLAAAHI